MNPLCAKIYWFLDTDDDMALVHLATPKMFAPQRRLTYLGGTVIPGQLKGQ